MNLAPGPRACPIQPVGRALTGWTAITPRLARSPQPDQQQR